MSKLKYKNVTLSEVKAPIKLFFILFSIVLFSKLSAQSQVFKSGAKWGIKLNDKTIIDAVYDTIFNFDVTNKVCLACDKSKTANANRFIKLVTTTYACNYLNFNKKVLTIKNDKGDTTSIFSLTKNSVKELYDNKNYFVVSFKNEKYLVDKSFNQITFKGYYNITLSPEPNFLIIEEKQESGEILTGLINLKEEKIIDLNYSGIKINTIDSLIAACSSGIRVGADDDVFDYSGKKLYSFKRHIDIATKKFTIHKIFVPNEYYIIYNMATKEEKILNASEIKLLNQNELVIKLRNDYYIYNLTTNEKKSYK